VGVVGLGLVGEERRQFFNSLFRNSVEGEVKGGRKTRRLPPSLPALPSSYPPSEEAEAEEEEEREEIGIWIRHSKTRQMNFTDPKMRREMIEDYYVPPLFLLAAEAMLLAVKGGEGGREGREGRGSHAKPQSRQWRDASRPQSVQPLCPPPMHFPQGLDRPPP